MSTINFDTEIVATHFDPKTRECFYTIERSGRRWTIGLHIDEFNKAGPTMQARQQKLANALNEAMRGPADGE